MRVERIKWSTVSIWTLRMTINYLNCKNFKKNANCVMKINKFVTHVYSIHGSWFKFSFKDVCSYFKRTLLLLKYLQISCLFYCSKFVTIINIYIILSLSSWLKLCMALNTYWFKVHAPGELTKWIKWIYNVYICPINIILSHF